MIVSAMNILDDLQVFFGATSSTTARLYARMPHPIANVQFAGRVIGPYCRHSRTLPASIPLVVLPGETLLAEVVVPDPCFWTPDLPMLYRFDIEYSIADSPPSKIQRWIGIRPLGVHARRFLWAARNWVLRGAQPASDCEDWSAWRRQELSCWLRSPSDGLLEELSHEGVLVAAEVTAVADLPRLARWPAVGLAVLRDESTGETAVSALAPNILLGQAFNEHEILERPTWGHFVAAEVVEADHFAGRVSLCDSPVIACRRADTILSLERTRAECDRLQRDLAGKGEFAGYVILQPKDATT
jgi:hypothetical protein